MPMIERLDEKAVARVSGPAWEALRAAFFDASQVLLAVSPEATSELTTIYVKFCVSAAKKDVYAVVWLKNSKQIIIGLSLPEEVESPLLGPPPQGTQYKGLTKYLTIRPGEAVPDAFGDWTRLAFIAISGKDD
jgi:hypothetical protein